MGPNINKIQNWLNMDIRFIAKASFWVMIGAVSAITANLAIAMAFANILDPAIYGTYKYILAIIEMTSALCLTGIGALIMKSVARGYDQALVYGAKKYLRTAPLAITATTIIAAYYAINENYILSTSIFIAGLLAPLMQAALFYTSFLLGKNDHKTVVLYQLVRGVIPVIILTGVLFITDNVIILITTYFLAYTLVYAGAYFRILKSYGLNQKLDKKLLNFATDLSIINFLSKVANQFDKLIVFQFLGPVGLANYYISYALPQQFSIIRKGIRSIIFPKMSRQELPQIRKTILFRSFLLLMLGIAVMITYMAIAPFLITTLFPVYSDSIIYSQLLAITVLFVCTVPYNIAITTNEYRKVLYFLKLSTIFFYIPLLTFLTIKYAIFGVIAALITKLLYELIIQVAAVHFLEPS
jgi:O-antigen/teichoic acid export membrane protein